MGEGINITCLNVLHTNIINVFGNVWQLATLENMRKSKLQFMTSKSECYVVDHAMWESMEAKVTNLATSMTEIKEILLMNRVGIGSSSGSKMFTTTTVKGSYLLTSGIDSFKYTALVLMPGLTNINPTPRGL
jgi:hypothetical protein